MKRIVHFLSILTFAMYMQLALDTLPVFICMYALLAVSFIISMHYMESSNEYWRILTIAIGIYACASIIVETLRYSDSIGMAFLLSAVSILCGIGISLSEDPNDWLSLGLPIIYYFLLLHLSLSLHLLQLLLPYLLLLNVHLKFLLQFYPLIYSVLLFLKVSHHMLCLFLSL